METIAMELAESEVIHQLDAGPCLHTLQQPGGRLAADGDELFIRWKVGYVVFSYFVSFLGALVAVEMNDARRMTVGNPRRKAILTAGVAFCIGTGAVWCTHFVGMAALQLTTAGGDILVVSFNAPLSFASWVAAVGAMLIGVKIAARDQFFGLVEPQQRVDQVKLILDGKKSLVLSEAKPWKIAQIILLSNLQWILLGGVVTGAGVCAMHYAGMASQVLDADMEYDIGFIALSVIIAAVTATVAYWLIFRMLVFKPRIEFRLVAAAVAAAAVCAMHYTGVYAGIFTYRFGKGQGVNRGISTEANYNLAVWVSFLLLATVFTWLLTDLRKSFRELKAKLHALTTEGTQLSTVGSTTAASKYSVKEPAAVKMKIKVKPEPEPDAK